MLAWRVVYIWLSVRVLLSRVLIDFWFNRHILTFVYVRVLTRDGWVWTGEHVCVFEREPGKGEGPRVSGQKQLLLCARETSSRERERGETDQKGPDLYMGCALCADSCGDEPDPVPVRGSVRRERAKPRGNMRLTKVGTSRIWFKVMSSGNMFTWVLPCGMTAETHARSWGSWCLKARLKVSQVVVMREVSPLKRRHYQMYSLCVCCAKVCWYFGWPQTK